MFVSGQFNASATYLPEKHVLVPNESVAGSAPYTV
jgi:hypothetical protein